MILPLSCFPSAPGQGAIGIEANNSNDKVIKIINQINNKEVFQMVQHEKSKLNIYGGGCHQKIGVSNWTVNDLELESIQGITDEGLLLNSYKILSKKKERRINSKRSNAFPLNDNEKKLFSRKHIDSSRVIKELRNSIVYISRKNVLRGTPHIDDSNIVWTSGLTAWKAAAQKGYWVNGTSDSFGESIDFDIDSLSGKISKRVKLTHMENKSTEMDIVPTYKLIFSDKKLGIEERTHFYWMSSFAFDCVTQKYPEIKNKIHGCGPGKTYDHILKNISNPDKVSKYLSIEDWESNFDS